MQRRLVRGVVFGEMCVPTSSPMCELPESLKASWFDKLVPILRRRYLYIRQRFRNRQPRPTCGSG